jgi:hypothetical protein
MKPITSNNLPLSAVPGPGQPADPTVRPGEPGQGLVAGVDCAGVPVSHPIPKMEAGPQEHTARRCGAGKLAREGHQGALQAGPGGVGVSGLHREGQDHLSRTATVALRPCASREKALPYLPKPLAHMTLAVQHLVIIQPQEEQRWQQAEEEAEFARTGLPEVWARTMEDSTAAAKQS